MDVLHMPSRSQICLIDKSLFVLFQFVHCISKASAVAAGKTQLPEEIVFQTD